MQLAFDGHGLRRALGIGAIRRRDPFPIATLYIQLFSVSPSTAVRLAASHRDRGDIAPKPQGHAPGTTGKLAPHMDFLTELVRAEPDITLQELAGALARTHGVSVQLSSIHRALVRSGLSYKKRLVRAGARPR